MGPLSNFNPWKPKGQRDAEHRNSSLLPQISQTTSAVSQGALNPPPSIPPREIVKRTEKLMQNEIDWMRKNAAFTK